MAESVDGEDRISELPVHIIHHILCRTNLDLREAAITCVLSKKWHYYWLSRPYLLFRQCKRNSCIPLENFVKLIDRPLRIHVEQNLYLAKFFLAYRDRELDPYLDHWIESAIKVNVSVLVIHAPDIDSSYYSLPDVVYDAKKLNTLWLSRCKFEFDISTTHIRFCSLVALFLYNVHISDAQMQSVIDKCPSIRNIRVLACKGMSKLYVVGRLHLHSLAVLLCKLDSVIVQAPKLESFSYTECIDQGNFHPCKIDILDGNNTLQTLELTGSSITDQQFRDVFHKFPNISVLHLTGCYKLKHIEIQSEKLNKVTLSKLESIEKIMIQAPNLSQFDFEGDKMPFLSMDSSSLERARLNFFLPRTVISNFGDVDSSWYTNLNHFVQNFNYSKGLMLVIFCRKTKNILIYENPREILIPPSHNVEIFIVPILSIELIIGSILLNRPSIMSILPCTDSKVLQVLPALERCTQNQNCGKECPFSTRFFHKHRILEEIISCTGTSEEEMASIWYTWLKSTSLIGKVNNFMFKWKEQA
ncbi:hypothetical protein KY284_010211 [Solanum tuberosum]|nr:hypothetical protein KY284_010211 [Solanum tuberosum]